MVRFNETVNLQTIGQVTPSVGSDVVASSLAENLKNFNKGLEAGAQRLAAGRGIQRAQDYRLSTGKDGLIQIPKKENVFFGSIENEAFHNALTNRINTTNKELSLEIERNKKAMLKNYIDGIVVDMDANIGKFEADSPNNILEFNDKVNSYSAGLLKEVDPSAREIISNKLNARIVSSRLNVYKKTIGKQNKQIKDDFSSNISSLSNQAYSSARAGDRLAAANAELNSKEMIASAVEAGIITKAEGAEQAREINQEIKEQLIRYKFDQLPYEDALTEISKLQKQVPQGWEADNWRNFLEDVSKERTLDESRKQIIAEQRESETKEQIASDLSDIEETGDLDELEKYINQISTKFGKKYASIERSEREKLVRTIEKRASTDRSVLAEKRRAEKEQMILQDKKTTEEDKIKLNTINNDITNFIKSDNWEGAKKYIDKIDPKYGAEKKKLLLEVKRLEKASIEKAPEFTKEEESLLDKIRFSPEEVTKDEIRSKGETIESTGKLLREFAASTKKGEVQKQIEKRVLIDFTNIFQEKEAERHPLQILPGGLPYVGMSDDQKVLFRENKARAMDRIKEFFNSKPDASYADAESFYNTIIKQDLADTIVKAVMFQPKASQGALDFLKKNPETKDEFKDTFGYLPEGY